MKDIKENECNRTGTSARPHSLYKIYTIFVCMSIILRMFLEFEYEKSECDRTVKSARWHPLHKIYTIFFDKSILFNAS